MAKVCIYVLLLMKKQGYTSAVIIDYIKLLFYVLDAYR